MDILKKVWNTMKRMITGVKNSVEKASNYLQEECGPLGRAIGKLLGIGLKVGLPMLLFGPFMGIVVALEYHFIFKPVGKLVFGIGKAFARGLVNFRNWANNKAEELNGRDSNEVFKEIENDKDKNLEEVAKKKDDPEKAGKDNVIDAEVVGEAEEKATADKGVKKVEKQANISLNDQVVPEKEIAERGYELDRLIHSKDKEVVGAVNNYLQKHGYKNINAWIVANPQLCVATSLKEFAQIQKETLPKRSELHPTPQSGQVMTEAHKAKLNLRDQLLESNTELYRESAMENIQNGIGLDKYVSSKDAGVAKMAESWLKQNGYKDRMDYIVKNQGLCLGDKKTIEANVQFMNENINVVGKHVKPDQINKKVDVEPSLAELKPDTAWKKYNFSNKTMNGDFKDKSKGTVTSESEKNAVYQGKHAKTNEPVMG